MNEFWQLFYLYENKLNFDSMFFIKNLKKNYYNYIYLIKLCIIEIKINRVKYFILFVFE